MKSKKEKEIKEYFEEYKTANNIGFITYGQARINVTLSASMKSLKEQAKQFIDKIVDDLKLIETQEHKTEILVEYKQTLNVSQAITSVTNRFKAIEEEKKKIEQEKELQKFVVIFASVPTIYSCTMLGVNFISFPSISNLTINSLFFCTSLLIIVTSTF